MKKAKKTRKRSFTLKERMQYAFDSIMSKGTIAMVGILFTITALVVILVGVVNVLFDGEGGLSIAGSIWLSLMHAIDAGTLTADSGSVLFMLLMTLVTICGLFITSVLIGIVNTGMEQKMASLRKGKSRVLEENHVIILGYNRNLFIILEKLIQANSNHEKYVVVVMDDSLEKEEMEDAIHQRIPNTDEIKVICRCGNIADMTDLQVCSPEYAKSIIINSEDDFATIKSILAVTTLLKKSNNTETFLTAVIQHRENYEAAQLAGENQAEIIFFDDTMARIVAQTSRQSGLSSIYTELLSFEGDEIYLETIPQVRGLCMAELNRYFPESTVIGIEKNGQVLLNPPGKTRVEQRDRVILLEEERGVSVPLAKPGPVEEHAIVHSPDNSPAKRRKMLILGYGPRLGKVLREEDQYLAPGSQILVAVQEEYRQAMEDMIDTSYKNIEVRLQSGDIYHQDTVQALLEWNPDSILVSNTLQENAQEDDNKVLVLLLQLRAISKAKHCKHMVTSEMRSVEDQELAQITEVRDFVVSSNITSLMVTQISQARELNRIYTELLSKEGSEIYMRPAMDYVELDRPINLYTACAAAVLKKQVFLGYRHIDPETNRLEIYTNLPKDTVVTFCKQDCFVVLSED